MFSNLGGETGKAFALFAVAFGFFAVVLAILGQYGLPEPAIAFLVVALSLTAFAVIGLLARTMSETGFFLAGRSVSGTFNGMATAAAFLSASATIGLVGLFFADEGAGLAVTIGWAAGFVLLAVLVAPYFRRAGTATVPGYLATRFGGAGLRLLGIVILIACSFAALAAACAASTMIATTVLGASPRVASIGVFALVLAATLFGGMRAVTLVAIAQVIVILFGFLAPSMTLSARDFAVPIPQLIYGFVLEEIAASPDTAIVALASRILPIAGLDWFNLFALALTFALGIASLPHIVVRSGTAANVAVARRSAGWGLVFALAILLTAPAIAAFTKLAVANDVVGATADALPDWVFAYGKLGQVKICGANAATDVAVATACTPSIGADGALRAADIAIAPDVVALAFPDITGLPYIMTALIAAGALGATLAAAGALAMAVAGTLGSDLYGRLIAPRAPAGRRLILTRLCLIAILALAAWLAERWPDDVFLLAVAAPALAAGGFFAPLVLGMFWSRANRAGAITGMVAGFGVTAFYFAATQYGGMPPIKIIGLTEAGIAPLAAAILGVPAGFVAMIMVTFLTPEPSEERIAAVEALRRPGGDPLLEDSIP